MKCCYICNISYINLRYVHEICLQLIEESVQVLNKFNIAAYHVYSHVASLFASLIILFVPHKISKLT